MAAPPPPAARRVPTGGRRADIARRARAQARLAEDAHPALGTPRHLRDAADALSRGGTESAKRHLRAAMNLYQPVSLIRHGVLDDEGHTAARQHLAAIHALHLQVQDVEDTERGNMERSAARRQFMNAPPRTSAGPGDRAAGGPADPAPVARQFALASPLAKVMRHQFDPGEPRDFHGRWTLVPNSGTGFNYDGPAGGSGHAQAMEAEAHKVREVSDTAANAVRHAIRMMVARRLDHARRHMNMAIRETQGTGSQRVMRSIRDSLDAVPVHAHPVPQAPTNPEQVRRSLAQMKTRFGMVNPNAMLSSAGLDAITLSARTAMLERTPAPRGRPGGPGLYDVKGMGHTPYLQQIVKALIEKRGMPPGKAYAIARGAIRKWMRGGGHVHPEVMAAAGKAEAGEVARQARAKASHGHAGQQAAIELTLPPGSPRARPRGQRSSSSGWNPAAHPRVSAGQAGGGQFTKGGGGQAGKRKPGAGHGMRGLTPGSRARIARKASLLSRARDDRARARQLTQTLRGLEAQQRSSSKGRAQATRAGQTGKTRASTPVKKRQAAKTPAKAGKAAARRGTGPVAYHQGIARRITALRAQIRLLLRQAAALDAQAKRLANDAPGIELAAWVHEPRGRGGKWVREGARVVTETGERGRVRAVHGNGLVHVALDSGGSGLYRQDELHHHDVQGSALGSLTKITGMVAATVPGRHSAGPRRRAGAYQRQPGQLLRTGTPGM